MKRLLFSMFGRMPLKFLDFIENKRGGHKLKKIFEWYVQNYFSNKLLKQTNQKRYKRVFMFVNSYPVFMSPMGGTHLNLSLEPVLNYIDNDVKVKYILANHPFKSRYDNLGIKIKSNFLCDRKDYKKRLIEDIKYFSKKDKLENLDIEILSDPNDSVENFLDKVLDFIEKEISYQDIIIFEGGKVQSIVLKHILHKIKVNKKIYLMTGSQEIIDKIEQYDIILTPEKTLNIPEGYYDKCIKRIRCKSERFICISDEFSNLEIELIEKMKNADIKNLYVIAKQKASQILDIQAIDIINKLTEGGNRLLIIGDKKDKILSKLGFNKNIYILEYSNYIDCFFNKISKEFNTVFILPKQITGNGGTNIMAALNGIPTVLFEPSDSKGYLPDEYFVSNKNDFLSLAKKLMIDKTMRDDYFKKLNFIVKNCDKKAKQLYGSFLKE